MPRTSRDAEFSPAESVTAAEGSPSIALVSYTGKQPQGYTVDWAPNWVCPYQVPG